MNQKKQRKNKTRIFNGFCLENSKGKNTFLKNSSILFYFSLVFIIVYVKHSSFAVEKNFKKKKVVNSATEQIGFWQNWR